ncbi:unnamed protein product, partial [Protopolystoma xenopodis]
PGRGRLCHVPLGPTSRPLSSGQRTQFSRQGTAVAAVTIAPSTLSTSPQPISTSSFIRDILPSSPVELGYESLRSTSTDTKYPAQNRSFFVYFSFLYLMNRYTFPHRGIQQGTKSIHKKNVRLAFVTQPSEVPDDSVITHNSVHPNEVGLMTLYTLDLIQSCLPKFPIIEA